MTNRSGGAFDASNGWEQIAAQFVQRRSNIGVSTLRQWAASLVPGASVLDVGCGFGVPVSQTLLDMGFELHALDASPSLVAEFHRRFPGVPVACEPAETSRFFDRTFDAVVAIGLIFLMPAEAQRTLIRRIPAALAPGGRLLLTAPTQSGSWPDILTGRESVSFGDEEYRRLLEEAGLAVVDEYVDEGENHYYAAQQRAG